MLPQFLGGKEVDLLNYISESLTKILGEIIFKNNTQILRKGSSEDQN